MDLTLIGIIGIVLMIALVFLRMPVGFSMGFVGFLGLFYVIGWKSDFSILGLVPFSVVLDYNKAVIPLFILMGIVASETGMAEEAYRAAHAWLGHIKGGLAMTTAVACGAFAAVSGSSIATAAAMGKVAYPEMQKYKYDTRLSIGSITAGGTVGILIPPSMGFILYSLLTEESIGQLFMAGLFPGILEVVFYMVVIWWLCRRNPQMGPPGSRTDLRDKLKASQGGWPIILLFLLVMGGIYLGVFTPMEAGAIGAFGALVIGFARKRLNRRTITESFLETGRITAMIFILIIGAFLFSTFLTLTKLPSTMADFFAGLLVNRYIVLIGILFLYIILGCFLDIYAAMFITVPILYPVIVALGFNPIWFGVLMVRVMEMGLITPPIGLNCFIVAGVTKVPLGTVYRSVIPFLIADIFHVALLLAFPAISLWLPKMMIG
jgi:C4-dicarboxylate transporter DctM subunit